MVYNSKFLNLMQVVSNSITPHLLFQYFIVTGSPTKDQTSESFYFFSSTFISFENKAFVNC